MARRARNVAQCFIGILTIAICLQLGFYLYMHSFSWRLISPSSRLSLQFFNEQNKQELGNARTQTTAATGPPYPYFNTESNWKRFKHKTTLITNRRCSQYYNLLILVSSAPANLERRNNIRKTWAFESAFKPRWTTVFLVAQTRIQSENISLIKEDEIHGDLVRGNFNEHYWNQTLKIQMGLEWAMMYCKFAFLLKADDDVFVNSVELLSFLIEPTTPKEKFYMGNHYKNPLVYRGGKWKVSYEEYNETHFPDFCPGFGYVLSHDVVILFVEAFAFVPYFRLDDVYVGMLANRTEIKIRHNDGFELDAPKQCIPNVGTLVRHGFYERSGTHGDCLNEIFNRGTKIQNYTR